MTFYPQVSNSRKDESLEETVSESGLAKSLASYARMILHCFLKPLFTMLVDPVVAPRRRGPIA
jgi:hypothetical protein